MKFGKNLAQVIEFSDPEWGPYWMNYKYLKKKINDIVSEQGGNKTSNLTDVTNPMVLSKSNAEVEFFRLLKSELKKTNDFFNAEEDLFRIRKARVWDGFNYLKEHSKFSDKTTWTRLSMACVKFYEDILLLENFAIMNYCGFSKILKKHDKLTGFNTREAFMRITMEQQSFTHHRNVIQMLKEAEDLFLKIQSMKSALPLKEEEKLFIEAIRDLNYQASRVRAAETESVESSSEAEAPQAAVLTIASTLFPHAASKVPDENGEIRESIPASAADYHPSVPTSNRGSELQSAEEGLQAATNALTAVAKRAYFNQTLPNLSSAISWISNVAGDKTDADDSTSTATAAAAARVESGVQKPTELPSKSIPAEPSRATGPMTGSAAEGAATCAQKAVSASGPGKVRSASMSTSVAAEADPEKKKRRMS